MRNVLCVLMALLVLSGCALTTIKPYKKQVAVEPERRPIVERVKEVFRPEPAPVITEEKEKILPLKEEKERILPKEEEEDIK